MQLLSPVTVHHCSPSLPPLMYLTDRARCPNRTDGTKTHREWPSSWQARQSLRCPSPLVALGGSKQVRLQRYPAREDQSGRQHNTVPTDVVK